jgi:hypothetical protein
MRSTKAKFVSVRKKLPVTAVVVVEGAVHLPAGWKGAQTASLKLSK